MHLQLYFSAGTGSAEMIDQILKYSIQVSQQLQVRVELPHDSHPCTSTFSQLPQTSHIAGTKGLMAS